MAKPLPVSSLFRADKGDAEVFGKTGMSEKDIDRDSLQRKMEGMAGNERPRPIRWNADTKRVVKPGPAPL